jgi:recombinational DNA repair protein (RecF pathway)
MIGATAQGIRLSQSKLRYYTQDYAHSLFSLVRGKEVWRIIGTKEIDGEINNTENKRLYVRMLSLLKRLLHGEEKNEILFNVIDTLHLYLSQNILDKEKMDLIEYVTVFRILNCLGYIHSKGTMEKFCTSNAVNEDILKEVEISKDRMIKEINDGLKESQL